jgi:hypothetical protein
MSWRQINCAEMMAWYNAGAFCDNPMLSVDMYPAITEKHLTLAVFSDDGKALLVTGLVFYWNGVAENWCIVIDRELMEKNAKSLVRDMHMMIDEARKGFKLHRIQCIVDSENVRDLRWATFFGFEPEGLMKKYGPDGKDYYRLARTF